MPDPEDLTQDDGEQRSNRPFWSGTITFGLVSIPVNLFPANRQARVSLRMLSPEGHPLARRYYAPEDNRDLGPDDMIRGYEIEKDKFVPVTDEELERLAPEQSRDIDLRRFVDEKSIPPLYFERAYFLAPSATGSAKAYRLLAETMEKTGRAGIATFVMRGKEYLVAILAENGILRAETLRFSDEIRSLADIGLEPAPAPEAKVKQFAQVISKLAKDDIDLDEMKDESGEKLRELAQGKYRDNRDVIHVAGAATGEGGEATGGDVVDILAILQRSLGQAKAAAHKAAAKETHSKPAAARKSPTKPKGPRPHKAA